MFVDHAIIHVRSGKGGDGCAHFLREKGKPKGGPDGGDGGRVGDVVVVGDPHVDTLVAFAYKPHWFAKDGGPGTGKQCTGAAGEDIIVPLPLGSQVFDAETDELIADVTGQAVDRLTL